MTYAPLDIKECRAFLETKGPLSPDELGIVGGPGHIATGTSYHLGKDQLKMYKKPYSAKTARDVAGLAGSTANASCALDIDDDLPELRPMSVWIVEQCRAGAPDTLDIREVIYSPDGVQVLQWDRQRGVTSLPIPHSDLSHRKHTHVSWYRDSIGRPKVGLFQRFYSEVIEGDDMFCKFGQTSDKVKAMQLQILQVAPTELGPAGADGVYGQLTADAVSRVLTGGYGTTYGPAEFALLQQKVAALFAGQPGPQGPAGPAGAPGQTPSLTGTRIELVGQAVVTESK